MPVTPVAATATPMIISENSVERINGGKYAADNTGKNKTDQSGDRLSPIDQSNSAEELAITADIRRALVDEKGLSSNAQNIKIITPEKGGVILRGVVDSDGERRKIAELAELKSRGRKVTNELTIRNVN
jgi:osmotically-inducible protein OsmY